MKNNNPLEFKISGYDIDDSMKIYKESSIKTVYDFNFKKKGNGRMICYELFPGIQLIDIDVQAFKLNEFHREKGNKQITINHCRKGRFECQFYGKYKYLEEGDLVAATKVADNQYSGFPLGFYEGIEIFIDIDIAKNSLNNILGYSFDLNELHDKISENKNFILIKSTEEIDHIFSEMYHVDENIKTTYFKLKILELFLFLSITPLTNTIQNRPHLSKNQADTIKNIKKELIENLSESITLEQLSKNYNISITSLKSSFKAVYGKPLFSWRKEYRLQIAKKLLKEKKSNIDEIANAVGYKNPSKFSAAFKKYYNISPSKYRFQNK